MNPIDKEINTLIMQEIGLEIGPKSHIVDQDTGVEIRINGVDVVAPGCYYGRRSDGSARSMEFDPYNNRKMMNSLFSYFTEKQEEESGVGVLAFYNVDNNDGGRVECRMSDNEVLTSGSYQRDCLKYVDLIMQMNGEENPDLKKYDILPEPKPTVKKKSPPKKKG